MVQATDCISGTGHFPPTSIQSPGLILEVGSLTGQQKTPNRILHVKPSSHSIVPSQLQYVLHEHVAQTQSKVPRL